MAEQRRRRFRFGLLALSAACAAILAIGYGLPGGSTAATTGENLPSGKLAAPSSDEAAFLDPSPELEIAQSEPKASQRAVPEPSPVSEGARSAILRPSAARPRDLPAGRLQIRAVDAGGRLPLDHVRVRAMSAERFADQRSIRGSASVELVLTPGSYSLLVMSPGYEPVELPPIEVSMHRELALDAVRMDGGSARILGTVDGERPPDLALRAELTGEGRRPCRECSWTGRRACPRCGYAEESSSATVTRAGTFEFGDLAGGRYAVRLIDSQDRTIGLPQFIELGPGESLLLRTTAVPLRSLRVELVDTDGTSLASEWATRLRGRGLSAPEDELEFVVVESAVRRPSFQCTFRAEDLSLAHAQLIPPEKPGQSVSGITAFCGRVIGCGPRRGVHDRMRTASDALRVEAQVPRVATFQVAAVVGADGLAHFDHVPSLELTLELESGPFRATATIPSTSARGSVRAELERDRPIASSEGGEAAAWTFLEYESGSGG